MLSTMNMQNCRPRRPSKGFTLAEILIALGILAIGMSMVAAIFPAAMEFNRRSNNSTLGTIICENGLALSEMMLTTETIGNSVVLLIYADDNNYTDNPSNPVPPAIPPPLTRRQRQYPTADDAGASDTRTGFVMLARKTAASGNTYQLITVAYRKTDKDNRAVLVPITCSITDRDITITDSTKLLRIGTPVINKATGVFAFVDSINADGTAGTLDIDPNVRTVPGGAAYVLVERKADGAEIPIGTMRRSPAIGAMSKVTGLGHADPSP